MYPAEKSTKQEFSSHAKLDKLMYMNVSHYVAQKDNENKKYYILKLTAACTRKKLLLFFLSLLHVNFMCLRTA